MSVAQARRWAYATIADAMLGEPVPPGREFEQAIAVVLNDTRKSRTKAERSLQMHLAITLTTWALVNRPEVVVDYAERLQAVYDEALAHLRGEEVKP